MAELRAYQPSFSAGVLAPSLRARVDLAKYSSGLKAGRNVFLHAHGGASNRAGTRFVTEVKNSSHKARLVSFQFNTEQSYQLEFGNLYFRVIRDGGLVMSGAVAYEKVTPYSHEHVGDLVFTQEADVMYITHVLYPVYKLARLADDNWTLVPVTFGPAIVAPATVTAAAFGPSIGTINYYYKVSAVSEEGEESLVSTSTGNIQNDLSISGNYNTVTWTAVTGAVRYIVYKDDGGVFGYIGGTAGLAFDDANITADLSDTPQIARNPFSGAGNYPRCSTFIEQRLGFGSTLNDPQAIWLSQSANYENFGYSQPLKASDAVTFRIKARQVNEVRAMIQMRGMMVLTSGAEWIVSGGSQSDAITPSAIRIDNQGYRGAARVQPIVVGNTVLFAQDRGCVIRDFSYQLSDDGFVGKDLTILSRHFFDNRRIKAWAYAQAPHSVLWIVFDDGGLVSLTYMKEHDVWGCTEHDSAAGAVFEDVSVNPEGNDDIPYFVVKRFIGGSDRRYVERMHHRHFDAVQDAFFVDSGLSYSGAPATVFSGLGHLDGQTVVALADGNVVRNLTVAAGVVTLPNAAATVHIGLPYSAGLATLDLDLGSIRGLGTVQGRMKSVAEVTMRVERTRGIFIGPRDGERTDEHLVEWKQRATEDWDAAIDVYTGDFRITPMWDWNTNGSVWVKQFDPLPMTILAIMPDVTVGR